MHLKHVKVYDSAGLLALITVATIFASAASAAPLIAAHRGNSSVAPENTIASIYAAVGFAELTEMDVRATADGELLLMHNATVNKTTDGRGAIRRLDSDQVQELDAGSWFSNEFTDERVPTLEEAASTAFSLGIEPLIERKSGSASLFHNVFTQMGMEPSDFRVISFSPSFIEDLHELNPNYQLGILGAGGLSPARLNWLKGKGADFLSWHHGSVRRERTVELVHTMGMELHVWTVNNEVRMEQLLELGVDGITTDRPELLHAVRESQFEDVPRAASSRAILVPEPAGNTPFCLALVLLLWSRRRRS